MPLYGTLKSMPLPDLLQWLCNAQVAGTLQVECNRVSKSIHLSGGMIIGCSSDDPPQRLGHFLLSRGKITEEQLREALHLQELSGQHLGMLLVELGALSPDELSEHLEAQAEETIYSLFDWDDAVFRFQEGENDPANVFPVGLRVEDVLLRGLQRYDEMREIREVFGDQGIVLKKTDKQAPTALQENRMGQALWDLVNGERTIAEILLQVHGSEYVVTKFFFELHRSGLVEIVCVKPIAPPQPTTEAAPQTPPVETAVTPEPADDESVQPPAPPSLPEPASAIPTVVAEPVAGQAPETRAAETTQPIATVTPQPAPVAVESAAAPPAAPVAEQPAAATPSVAADEPLPAVPQPAVEQPAAQQVAEPDTPDADLEDLLSDFDPDIDLPAAAAAAAAPTVTETGLEEAAGRDSEESGLVHIDDSPEHSLEKNLEKARSLMAESQFEQALEILDRVYSEHPGEESLRRLTAEAEAAFVEKAYRHYLPPSKVLVLLKEAGDLESEEDLSPSEFFLLSRIDGTWDIKSIIQIAPLRESDALRTLKRMRENGLIDLRDP